MYIVHVTDENYNKCTDNENNIDIILPTLVITIPCGITILCLMSLMIYTLIKTLLNNNW